MATYDLITLHHLQQGGRLGREGLLHLVAYRAVNPRRSRLCPCGGCADERLNEELAHSRPDGFRVRGRRYRTAFQGLTALWAEADARLAALPATPALDRAVDARVAAAAAVAGLALDSGGQLTHPPEAGGHDAEVARAEFQGVLVRTAVDQVGAAWQLVEDAANGPTGRAPGAGTPEDAELVAEVCRQVSLPPDGLAAIDALLAQVDLGELAAEVEAEFGRAVCWRCYAPKPRTRPKADLHARWLELSKRGKTSGQIAILHKAQTSESVPPNTINKAVRRAKRRKR